ncbi:hypothetical protein ACFYVL_12065 [Streptomyces sp. NPDC004111]|uniref:LppU/SCO3897 family protein n=1 Tax=Streptomyces sp. NPDC004111 TaxID=3364690 RepID=UPI0036BF3269
MTHPQPYPHPNAPQQQGPYGSPPYGQPGGPGPYAQPAPYGQPGPYGHPGGTVPRPGCEVCGAQPATPVTVRSHQGMVVIMRTVTRRGVYCRTCGLAVYRQLTSSTLVTGWWGLLSLFVTPFVVLLNVLGARAALLRLPEPHGAVRPPLDPGRRVLHRAPAMLILTPFALVALAIPTLMVVGLLAKDDGPVTLSVGDCVRNEAKWPEQQLEKVDCGSAQAEYRVTDRPSCGPTDYLLQAEYTVGSPRPGFCLNARR